MAVRTHVQKNGDTTYYGLFRGPDGKQVAREHRTVKAGSSMREHDRARIATANWAHEQRLKVKNGEWRDDRQRPRLTFHKLVKRFLKEYRTRSGRMVYYEQRAVVWRAHIADKPVDRVSVRDVDRLRRKREAEGVAAETIRKDLTTLSTLFRWAKARDLAAHNPADPDLVRRPPKSRPNPCPLSRTEVVALLDALDADFPYVRPIVELAIETGADRTELRTLNWNRHVDRKRKVIMLPRSKTGVGRALPYENNRTIRRVLAEAWKVRHRSGAVFLHDGEPVHPEALKTAERRAWKRAGITKPKPWKSLRATFATRKAEAGVDVPTIAALMGLTSSHVLEHYINPSGVHMADAMADEKAARAALAATA
jgi:integrase